MAWSFDAGWLDRGESIQWAFWWPPRSEIHDYKGIQVVHARALREGWIRVTADVRLTVTNPGLQLEDEFDNSYAYFVTVTNEGSGWYTRYELIGTRVD